MQRLSYKGIDPILQKIYPEGIKTVSCEEVLSALRDRQILLKKAQDSLISERKYCIEYFDGAVPVIIETGNPDLKSVGYIDPNDITKVMGKDG